MEICVCVKRVPVPGGRVPLTADARAIDTRSLGFTVSPHEECAVEEAVRLVERLGGSTTVVTLGPAAAEAQLRDAMALGPERAVLLETDGEEWDPGATAKALVDAIRDAEAETGRFDLILLGHEAADSADYQVPVHVGHLLGRPVATGINALAVDASTDGGAGTAVAGRAVPDGWDRLHVQLPAVLSVREGLNLPRYPSLPGRLRAKKRPVTRRVLERPASPLRLRRLVVPEPTGTGAEILGRGAEAAPLVVETLRSLGLVGR